MKHFVIIAFIMLLWEGGVARIQKAKSPAAAAETAPVLALPATAAAAAAARIPGRTGGG